jgi:hypothetical protein
MAETDLEYAWFFRAEFPMVLRTVFLILGDRGKAEDVTQEAFIQLLSHWKKISRYERPDAWVRRVAIRLAVKAQKGATLSAQEHIAKLDEEYELLSSKVDEQHQSKVESASKYRVRLSGIVLLNLFANKGQVENQDFPTVPLAVPPGTPSGSVGATLRQSQLGLEIFGPRVAGARTSADLQMDFSGGFQNTWDGVDAGIIRLRTATMRLDWAKTSIIAGQDGLFFSPTTPTSFATLAVPALAYAGNLWNWTPQVRIEHRFTVSENSSWLVQAGILDNLNGDFPVDSNFRAPQASELSRQPAYASRAAWSHVLFGQKLTLGGGGYYGRQNYGFSRNVNAWAGMADWAVPLGRRFALTGKFYRGSALGGLGEPYVMLDVGARVGLCVRVPPSGYVITRRMRKGAELHVAARASSGHRINLAVARWKAAATRDDLAIRRMRHHRGQR